MNLTARRTVMLYAVLRLRFSLQILRPFLSIFHIADYRKRYKNQTTRQTPPLPKGRGTIQDGGGIVVQPRAIAPFGCDVPLLWHHFSAHLGFGKLNTKKGMELNPYLFCLS